MLWLQRWVTKIREGISNPGVIAARIVAVVGVLSGACFVQAAQTSEELDFFESKVRPLLIDKCLDCHSHETETSGGLSLDSREDWMRGGDLGQAISPEDWEASLVWKAVNYRDPHLQMPPDGKLKDRELEVLKQWLSSGAVDPRLPTSKATSKQHGLSVEEAKSHWAYRLLDDSLCVPGSHRAASPIDAFLEEAQSRRDLMPGTLASQEAIKRRLFLDLTGMNAPAVSETLNSGSSRSETTGTDDYQLLVDELLASPRFGEHFARHWMDAVRFAESITLRGFVLPDAWRYREYLIDSFNHDHPIDQFIIDQIAGDLIKDEHWIDLQRKHAAASMLVLGDTNLEEQDKKQLEMDFIDEQIDVLGKAFLGQTISCARCHDHKFDPIPTKDYYAIAGILKSSNSMEHDNVSRWITNRLPLDPESEKQFLAAEAQANMLKSEIDRIKKSLSALSGTSSIKKSSQLTGIVIDDSQAELVGDWKKSTHHPAYVDEGYLHDGHNSSLLMSATFRPNELQPGTYEIRIAYAFGDNRASNVLVRIFSANGEDSKLVNQRKKPSLDGLWYSLGQYQFEQGGRAEVEISNFEANGHVIVDAIQFLSIENLDDQSKPALTIAPAQAEATETELKSQLVELEKQWNSLKTIVAQRPTVMGVKPVPSPKDLAIHIRGSVHQLGSLSPRGFLQFLTTPSTPSITENSNGRSELAKWIASSDNPLTARVYVNRIWSKLMGSGLVMTLDNFGTTGEPPSNQQLLDWLSLQFMKNGWSTKWLVREIVTSEAYRRTSVVTAEQLERDPDNVTFSRVSIKHLPPEAMRDSLLQASGELDLEVLRRSNFPASLKEDYGFQHVGTYRTVYGPWFRNSTPQLYQEFDGPNLSFSTGARNTTITAPQALALWNSSWIADRCQRIAARVLKDSKDRESAILQLYSVLLNRSPSHDEVRLATEILVNLDEQCVADLAKQLIASLDFRLVE
ncbi:DUF1553 domain-containing protein [Pirellulaceae bacterium SH449]